MTQRSDSHRLKFGWAMEHLKLLDQEVRGWLALDGNEIRDDLDPITGEHLIWLELKVPIPDTWGLKTGDIAHNFRSSLDHLAYSLMIAYTTEPTSKQETDSEFPIFGPKAPSASVLRRKVGGIDPAAQAIIKGLQPHLKGANYADDLLWCIHDMNRLDKHRLLQVVLTNFSMMGFSHGMAGRFRLINFSQEVGDGAELVRYSPNPAEVHVDPLVLVELTLLGQRDFVPFLQRVGDYIDREVFTPLEPFLASPP